MELGISIASACVCITTLVMTFFSMRYAANRDEVQDLRVQFRELVAKNVECEKRSAAQTDQIQRLNERITELLLELRTLQNSTERRLRSNPSDQP